jgi:chaperone required for assembly of F1-ATPase
MRDIFSEIFANQPLEPTEAARRSMRPRLAKRFYRQAGVGEDGFAVLLDGKPVKTPARRALAAPTRALAEAIAAEWNAQGNVIDPAAMPLTRLANAVIDAVTDAPAVVAAEIANYLGSDLVCYRAEGPAGLIAAQAKLWDPLLDFAREAFGAHFVLAQGVVHIPQPVEAIAAAAKAIPADPNSPLEIWRLGALSVVTTLTGSALIALALAAGRLTAEQAWAAAQVDEDWNMTSWGRDRAALDRRAFQFADLQAAATVLAGGR